MLQEFTSEVEKTAKSVVDEIHTALPGEIVSYDGNVASVKPIGKLSGHYRSPGLLPSVYKWQCFYLLSAEAR